MQIIIGNIISTIANILLIISILGNSKKDVIKLQIGDALLHTVSSIVLGGYTKYFSKLDIQK